MPLTGNLATMPLPDLLQWLGVAGKTGRLEVERNKVRKNILLRGGRVIGCGSDEPADKLGHYLVAQGRIGEETLREALKRHEAEHRPLGEILVTMSALTLEELTRHLEQKTEESIFGIFAWSEGEFRFHEGEIDVRNLVPVDLRVEDVLLRGAQRLDESQRIREVLDDQGIVLAATTRPMPPEVGRNRMARTVLDLVNGERTVAEILLHSHASEFLVTKFLYELHRLGIIEIVGRKQIAPPPEPVPDVDLLPFGVAEPAPVRQAATGAVVAQTVPAAVSLPSGANVDPADLEFARKLMDRGDFEAALDILDRAYKARPSDAPLRALLAEAEATFVEKAYRHYLPPTKIPFLMRPLESLAGEDLSPVEFFLASRIDGSWDVHSIISIAPIREVDALRTLKRLREKSVIDLKDAG